MKSTIASETRSVIMEVREKLEDVLKGLSLIDEERLGAFSSFANKHRKRVVQTVDEMSQMLGEIKQER
jgi:hypothetical protein